MTKSVADEIREMEIRQEELVEAEHQFDNALIMTFISLLILTLLTCWFFKYRRLRFVHETGLAILYGLVAGAIIRYTTVTAGDPNDTATFQLAPLVNQTANNDQVAPQTVFVEMRFSSRADEPGATGNETRILYQYDLKGQVREAELQEAVIDDKATFDPELFFNVLLPPIIFYAGYIMKRRHFFRNIGAIITFAFVGTAISAFATAGIAYALTLLTPLRLDLSDALFFGALISATDPVTVLAIFTELHVDVDLYAIVFGESVLNDAIAIVMVKTVEEFERAAVTSSSDDATLQNIIFAVFNFIKAFVCSFLIGFAIAAFTSIITKYTKLRDFPLLETSMFVLLSYSTFLLAEALGLAGIVAMLFCGIVQAHYSYNNLSKESRFRTRQVFELLSFLAENFVFAYIGVSTMTFRYHHWDAGFISICFMAIVVGRALNVYPLSYLLNLGRRAKITSNKQHMMMFSGLRGAMAFALAIRNTSSDIRRLFFSTTLLIVIFTVFVCGGLTTQVLIWLRIRTGITEDGDVADTELVAVANAQRSDEAMQQNPPVRSNAEIATPSPSVAAGELVLSGEGKGDSPIVVPGTAQSILQPAPVKKARLFAAWSGFDKRFMKPLLTHAKPPLTETLPACCYPLARLLSSAEQLAKPTYSQFDNDNEDEDDDAHVNSHAARTQAGANNEVITTSPSGVGSVVSSDSTRTGAYRRGQVDATRETDVTLLPVSSANSSEAPAQRDAPLVSLSGDPLGYSVVDTASASSVNA